MMLAIWSFVLDSNKEDEVAWNAMMSCGVMMLCDLLPAICNEDGPSKTALEFFMPVMYLVI
eukprot:129580-Amphidinium_carterae.1